MDTVLQLWYNESNLERIIGKQSNYGNIKGTGGCFLFDLAYMSEVMLKIIGKLGVTLQITLTATIFSVIIGAFLAVTSYNKTFLLYRLSKIYISFIRGTPLVAQLYFFYYGLAIYSGVIKEMAPIAAVSIVLSLNTGAFMSESFRGALLSVDPGQKEAAYALGMGKALTMRTVILPQALRVALPPLFNDVINLIKASSLAFMLGVTDIMGEAKIEGTKTFRYFEIYAAVMLIYWALITLLGFVHKYIEKRCER